MSHASPKRRLLVEHGVPDASRPIVVLAARQEHLAAQPGGESLYRGTRQGGNRSTRLLSSKFLIEVLGIQFEHVIIVIEEVQSPIGTCAYELAPHRLNFGDGGFQHLGGGTKGNVIPGPGTLNGCAYQHNPGAPEADKCLEMTLVVLALDHSRAEEVTKQRGRPGGVLYDEGDVAYRFEHGSPR